MFTVSAFGRRWPSWPFPRLKRPGLANSQERAAAYPVSWLQHLKKYLKSDARLAIVDVDPSKFPPERPYKHAWAKEKFVAFAAEAGYVLEKATNDYRMHQVLVFRLSDSR